MARRARTPRDTRGKLIEGAGKALVRHGFRTMTVQHVIQQASLSRRTFYQYFGDKDAVLLALYERVVDDLVESIEQAVRASEDPMGGLSAGIDAYLDQQQSGGRLVTLLQAEASNPASSMWPLRERALDAMVALTNDEVKRLSGMEVDPLVYRGLYLTMESLVLHVRAGGPFAPDSRARVEATVKPMVTAILASLNFMPPAPT